LGIATLSLTGEGGFVTLDYILADSAEDKSGFQNGAIVICDEAADSHLKDLLWLATPQTSGGGSGSGCDAGIGFGIGAFVLLAAGAALRRKS
jgi:hypothetical protein